MRYEVTRVEVRPKATHCPNAVPLVSRGRSTRMLRSLSLKVPVPFVTLLTMPQLRVGSDVSTRYNAGAKTNEEAGCRAQRPLYFPVASGRPYHPAAAARAADGLLRPVRPHSHRPGRLPLPRIHTAVPPQEVKKAVASISRHLPKERQDGKDPTGARCRRP